MNTVVYLVRHAETIDEKEIRNIAIEKKTRQE